MKTTEYLPSFVSPTKVLEWTFASPRKEGVHLVGMFSQECSKEYNWLVFYCWCYSLTNGFTDPCCANWDYANLGNKYETSREGIRDAFSEFIKFEDTDVLPNSEEVQGLYLECLKFCEGVVYKPVPETEKPKPEPTPEPTPATEPPVGGAPVAGFDWKKLKAWLLPILGLLVGLAGPFVPGWAKIALDLLLKVFNGM